MGRIDPEHDSCPSQACSSRFLGVDGTARSRDEHRAVLGHGIIRRIREIRVQVLPRNPDRDIDATWREDEVSGRALAADVARRISPTI